VTYCMSVVYNSVLKCLCLCALCFSSSSSAKRRHRSASFRYLKKWKLDGAILGPYGGWRRAARPIFAITSLVLRLVCDLVLYCRRGHDSSSWWAKPFEFVVLTYLMSEHIALNWMWLIIQSGKCVLRMKETLLRNNFQFVNNVLIFT
jgi:hypothetical protein